MEIKSLNKKELDELITLYNKERKTFPWLISLEEFAQDYVKYCDNCHKMFVTDCDDNFCESCEYELREEEKEEDPDWEEFDRNKDHYVYGLY
jgi:predicted amidophosphoribosyltransferase